MPSRREPPPKPLHLSTPSLLTRTWYHGSPYPFTVGHVLMPALILLRTAAPHLGSVPLDMTPVLLRDGTTSARAQLLWITSDPDEAMLHARNAANSAQLDQVEPAVWRILPVNPRLPLEPLLPGEAVCTQALTIELIARETRAGVGYAHESTAAVRLTE